MPTAIRIPLLRRFSTPALYRATCAMHFVAVVGLFLQVLTSALLLAAWATSGSISSQMLSELQRHGSLVLHYMVLLAPGTLLLLQCRMPASATQDNMPEESRRKERALPGG